MLWPQLVVQTPQKYFLNEVRARGNFPAPSTLFLPLFVIFQIIIRRFGLGNGEKVVMRDQAFLVGNIKMNPVFVVEINQIFI